LDLRVRILRACQEQEDTQADIAERFCVHVKTVEKLWKQWRDTGSAKSKPHGGGVAARLAGASEQLCRLLAEQNDWTNQELARLMGERHGLRTSAAAVSRALVRLGLTRKKRR
jgi:transposase